MVMFDLMQNGINTVLMVNIALCNLNNMTYYITLYTYCGSAVLVFYILMYGCILKVMNRTRVFTYRVL